MARELDAVHVRHVDVGQHEIGGRALQQVERLAAVLRLADDRQRQRGEQSSSRSRSRRRAGAFVVDDQHAQRGVSHGLPPAPGAEHAELVRSELVPRPRGLSTRRAQRQRPRRAAPMR